MGCGALWVEETAVTWPKRVFWEEAFRHLAADIRAEHWCRGVPKVAGGVSIAAPGAPCEAAEKLVGSKTKTPLGNP